MTEGVVTGSVVVSVVVTVVGATVVVSSTVVVVLTGVETVVVVVAAVVVATAVVVCEVVVTVLVVVVASVVVVVLTTVVGGCTASDSVLSPPRQPILPSSKSVAVNTPVPLNRKHRMNDALDILNHLNPFISVLDFSADKKIGQCPNIIITYQS